MYSEPDLSRKPIVIGLAGGIGSGKSEVASCFEQCGAMKIDADALVGEAYADPQTQTEVIALLGKQAYLQGGKLNRSWIADQIFNDPDIRLRLNAIIHPRVEQLRQAMVREASNDSRIQMIVLDIPLLFETGLEKECDAVVFIQATDNQRRQRVHHNRGWSRDELERRDRSQMPASEKRLKADYIVQNNGSRSDLQKAIQELFRLVLTNKDKR